MSRKSSTQHLVRRADTNTLPVSGRVFEGMLWRGGSDLYDFLDARDFFLHGALDPHFEGHG